MAARRRRMKSSWMGIGFSHHSVPSLSNTATRSAGGTWSSPPGVVTRSTNSMIAARAMPSVHKSRAAMSLPSLAALGERVLELGDHLVDREAGRLLARREVLEGGQELSHHRGRRQRDVVVVQEPVIVSVRGDVCPLEGVGAQVEQLGNSQGHE